MVAQPIYATRYDNTGAANPYLTVSLPIPDGQQLTASGWFKPNSTGNNARLMRTPGGGFVYFISGGRLRVIIDDEANVELRTCYGEVSVLVGAWNHFIFSVDLSDLAKQHFYVNGIEETDWRGSDLTTNIDLSGYWWMNGNQISHDGCSTEWWVKNTYFDLSDPAELAKFYVADGPSAADLGANGELPDGGAPQIYLRGQYPNHHINSGTEIDFGFWSSGDMRECVDAPLRDPGASPPSSEVQFGYTYEEMNGAMFASTAQSQGSILFGGERNTLESRLYVRPVSPDGEQETSVFSQDFDTCNIGPIDHNTPTNTPWCGDSFLSGEMVGTISQLGSGNRHLKFAQTKSQAETYGHNHTDISLMAPSWEVYGSSWHRRLKLRTHYRIRFRVRLGPDFHVATGDNTTEGLGWDIIAQVKWGNIGGSLNASGGGNPSLAIGAFMGDASKGLYNCQINGHPDKGGGTNTNFSPGGMESFNAAGNYYADVGEWKEWVIDWFNSDGQSDGFAKVTIGGVTINEVSNAVVGLRYKDTDEACETIMLGVYKYPGQYDRTGDGGYAARNTVELELDDITVHEVTQSGGDPEQKPISFNRGEVQLEQAILAVKSVGVATEPIVSGGMAF